MNERMFPMSVDSKTSFLTNWTRADHGVPLVVGVGDDEVSVRVSDVVGHKLRDTGQLGKTARNIALSTPAMIVFHMTHHVGVIAKTFITTFTLKWFL